MIRTTGRPLIAVLAAAIVVVLGAGTAFAFWSVTSSGSGNANTDALAAPVQTNPSNVTSSSAQINWTSVTTGWQKDATYTATVDAGAQTCNAAASVGNCSLSGLTSGTTYTVTLTATFSSWTSAGSNTKTVTPAIAAPAAPTSVQLSNGGGQSSAFVNNANKSSVNFAVALPSTSLGTDTVHLTVGDGVPAHTVTPATKSGTLGSGTVNFTALDLSGLNDGTLTVTAWVTNAVGGTSGNTTASPVKDVVAPTATLSVVAPAATGKTLAAGFVGSSLHFRPCTGNFGLALVATETDATSGAFSATFPAVTSANGWTAHSADLHSTPAGGPFTSTDYLYSANNCQGNIAGNPAGGPFSVSTSDAAGNTGSVSLTFSADSTAPTVSNVTLNDGGQAGSATGRIDTGDFAEVTYGEAMDASSFCSTWVNNGSTQTATGAVSVSGGSTNDVLTIGTVTGCTFTFGQINLNKDYNTAPGAMTFASSTITYDPSTNKLRIVLGTRSGGTQNSTLQTGIAPSYKTGSNTVESDLVGNAIATGSTTTGTATRF